MQEEIRTALDQLLLRTDLFQDDVTQVFGAIMDGRCNDIEISALLTALAVKGETEAEVAGAAEAMRHRAARIPTSRTGLLDTCGTGGDHLSTFNISTATAIVLAAADVSIAKHGNRKASSSSGSADVLEAMGVNIELSAEQAGQCLDEIGICFCYARLIHGAMKHVAPVRTALGIRTIFNLLGPLTNPAGAEFQLLGAHSIATARKLAGALARLNRRRAFVVCGSGQLDEVSLWGRTTVFEVQGDSIQQLEWAIEDLGLPSCSSQDLEVHSPQESAQVIGNVLAGQPGPARNTVVANAAAGLLCVGKVDSLLTGVRLIEGVLDAGLAAEKLRQLVETSQRIAASS